ncbi:hypothetical protein AGABI2DRAFT_75325, partial [Agaricus bisporus var. bisporus H97]|uniref:hypothetical protein n=1 Tax=Agaricus bisporus var. bisporus (strain H97 / ATCC MYA-4626 / FGSC 10389) TaxID=936046 RepID=UPI00029F563D
THWNSTYDLLAFAKRYQKAFDVLTAECGLKLRKFEMEQAQPQYFNTSLGSIEILLKQYSTLLFSCSETSNITLVVPSMDHLDQVLATSIVLTKYNEGIQKAIHFGKQTLNKYYSRTDSSTVYRISMGKALFL